MRSRSGSQGANREAGHTITAVLEGGPLAGRCLDVQADDGSTCRYCLAEWAQAGPSAVYTFLHPV